MEQLHALDSMYLGIENENVQANIGGVSVFDGPAPTIEQLRARVASRLHHAPRCRQRVQKMPPGLGHPIWVDDENFDLAAHMQEINLGRSVSFERVREHYGEIMGQHLDRNRPLWRISLVRGLPEGQWAILWTVHHAMVDGIAATELMSLLLSFEPEHDAPPAPEEWTPRGRPDVFRAIGGTVTGPGGPLHTLRVLGRGARRPLRTGVEIGRTLRDLVPAGRAVMRANPSPLNAEIGPDRLWHTAELDLDKVKLAGTLHGGTVNDVVLAAVTDGLRAFLIADGSLPHQCRTRTMVPVSIRTKDERGVVANRVSAVFVDLPVCTEDPVRRLSEIRQQMDRIKQRDGERAGRRLGQLIDHLPNTIFDLGEQALLQTADISRMFNTVTTNVPGPQAQLYCLGRPMRSMHPYIMLMKDLRIATAVLSYNGKIYFGATGDRASVSRADLEAVCNGIERALDDLIRIPAPRRGHLKLVA